MPVDRLVLILVCVFATAGVTLFLGTLLSGLVRSPALSWLVVIPVALIAYLIFRVISDRLSKRDDDHYDRIEK
ncbi:hypothetical protein DDZ14_00680 [Maritimibacter sp. 55A14]|uniref:hypothetical protein n=1 Tax=Maritimibacter sp. 55A14 TaxID=2174844 RepID=UPI000D61048C|nr:hypothetical protein [Maritimibacter sp. 55A14]PWE34434.1 hypothetical protein DDZ14_00680 [Maritimibacter sp. 55A14]